MNKLTIDDLLNLVKSYNPSEVEIIKKPIIMLTIFIRDKKDKVENLILLILSMLPIFSQKCTLIGIQYAQGYYTIH
jgi:hypothetical protein